MNCTDARYKLVAWSDAELSPGEMAQVGEHVARCADCLQQASALAAATPMAFLPQNDPALADKWREMDRVLEAELEQRPFAPATRPQWDRARDWLAEEMFVPTAAAIAYAAAFLLLGMWGASNWQAAQNAEAALAQATHNRIPIAMGAPEVGGDVITIPFAPAAYKPEAAPTP